MIKFDGNWHKGIHESILEEELFEKVQEKLKLILSKTSNQ